MDFTSVEAIEFGTLSQHFGILATANWLSAQDYAAISKAKSLLRRTLGADSVYLHDFTSLTWGEKYPASRAGYANPDHYLDVRRDAAKASGLMHAAAEEVQARANTTGPLSPEAAQLLRCFLSRRFVSNRSRLYALDLERFFHLVGVEVVTGEAYEPRSLSEKVSERLAGIDFGVLLVTVEDGESFWTRDEVNTFRDHHPTVLVEDGARFAQGVFGDLEYIPFAPDHIGDAFIKLMEGIAYIRRNLRPRE